MDEVTSGTILLQQKFEQLSPGTACTKSKNLSRSSAFFDGGYREKVIVVGECQHTSWRFVYDGKSKKHML